MRRNYTKFYKSHSKPGARCKHIYIDMLAPCTWDKKLMFNVFVCQKINCKFEPEIDADTRLSKADRNLIAQCPDRTPFRE